MKLRLILFLSLLCSTVLHAQVVNTEKKRLDANKEGLSGSADVGLSIVRNARQINSFSNRIQLQYKKKKHTFLALNDINLMRVDTSAIQNRAFQHFRYNLTLRPWLIPEAFVQAQYNQIMQLRFRFLSGAGPRFRIVQNDTARLFIGTLYMYEFEEELNSGIFHRDHRLSTYVSFGYAISHYASLDHITYFQPRFDDPTDFRLSSESTLQIFLSKKLAYKTVFNITYDAAPPEGVENAFYAFTNTLSYKF